MDRQVVPLPDISARDLGDGSADFESGVRAAWPQMARLAYRMTSGHGWEDVLQDALTLAWRKRGRFDPTRGNATPWLLALVVDQARKAHRAASRRPVPASLNDATSQSSSQLSSDIDLQNALRRLTERQRLAIDLYYFVGLPVADAALVMGCSAGTVKSTLSDARGRLRDFLSERES